MRGIEGNFDVVGSSAPLAFFSTLEPARLSHGYLFTGPDGVGKKTFARRLAQSLLCETPKTTLLGYCGFCVGCTLFVAGTHPDFFGFEGMIKIGKFDVSSDEDDRTTSRELIEMLALHGYRGHFRVVVLGDVAFPPADETGPSNAGSPAANALLKLFEEPPSGVIVILTTSAPGSLIPTIRSRFMEITFGPVPVADIGRVLVRDGVAPDRAHFAAEVALGSIARARAILGDDDAGIRDAAFAWFENAVLGRPADTSFLRLDDRSLTGAEKRALVRELIELVRAGARDWAALALGDGNVPLLAEDQRARIARLPAREPQAIVSALAAAGDAARLAATNVSAGLVLDFLRIQLAPR